MLQVADVWMAVGISRDFQLLLQKNAPEKKEEFDMNEFCKGVLQLLELTHRQQLCVHPSHKRERNNKLQEHAAMTDHDLAGRSPRI